VLSDDDYVFLFLLKQLQPEVWAALIITTMIVSGSSVILCAASCEHWKANDVFNLALTLFTTTPRAEPRASAARMVVMLWLLLGVVLRAAYEGEMKVLHPLKDIS